jgi:hypothetical protein
MEAKKETITADTNSLNFCETSGPPSSHGNMSYVDETPAHHIYDSIEMDQDICNGREEGDLGTYVVISEHGEEYLLRPIIPEVRRFSDMRSARAVVARLLAEHRRAGHSVSSISSYGYAGEWMLHNRERTLTIQLNCRISEAAYHYHRQSEIRKERISETYNT